MYIWASFSFVPKCYYNSNTHIPKWLLSVVLWNLVCHFKSPSIYDKWVTFSHLSKIKIFPLISLWNASKSKVILHLMYIEPNLCQMFIPAALQPSLLTFVSLVLPVHVDVTCTDLFPLSTFFLNCLYNGVLAKTPNKFSNNRFSSKFYLII